MIKQREGKWKFLILTLCLVFALGMAGCSSDDSAGDDATADAGQTDEAIDVTIISAEMEKDSLAETIFDKHGHKNVYHKSVYHNVNSETDNLQGDLTFEAYYFKNLQDEVAVLWFDDKGDILYVTESKAIAKTTDGTITVLAREGDDLFKGQYAPMLAKGLLFKADPSETVVDAHIEDGLRTVTIETPVEKSIVRESLKNLWGYEDGTFRSVFVTDMEEGDFVSCDEYHIDADGNETEIFTSTFEYDVTFEPPTDIQEVE